MFDIFQFSGAENVGMMDALSFLDNGVDHLVSYVFRHAAAFFGP